MNEKNKNEMVEISFEADAKLVADVEKLCKDRGITISELVEDSFLRFEAKKEAVTNYIIKSTNVDFAERFILPGHRTHMRKVIAAKKQSDDYIGEQVIVVGNDGMWWNDSLDFVFDRMSDGHYLDALCEFEDDLEKHPLKSGETRTFEYNGQTYSATADCTDLSNDGVGKTFDEIDAEEDNEEE